MEEKRKEKREKIKVEERGDRERERNGDEVATRRKEEREWNFAEKAG